MGLLRLKMVVNCSLKITLIGSSLEHPAIKWVRVSAPAPQNRQQSQGEY